MDIKANLAALGYALPVAAAPAANYVPYVVAGNMLYISGQIPFLNGEKMHFGTLGDDYTIAQGQEAARACALNILAQVGTAVDGDWSRVRQCVKLGGFVASTADFTDHPAVINGASDLLADVLGEKGKHARFAVGVPNLPFGVAVEIDAVFDIDSV